MAALIFGCGYLGSLVARRWRAAGRQVYVVTRDPRRAETFATDGFRPIVADVLDAASLAALPKVDVVLYAVGYDRTSQVPIERVYVEGLKNALDAQRAAHLTAPARWIYVSSTGVYGGAEGDWVDEDSPCAPATPGGKACLAAEQLLQAHPLGAQAVILRMAGIYGPGRVSFLPQLERGEPLATDPEGYLNLIHVEDAATCVLAAESIAAPQTLNVTDGQPVARRAYYTYLAEQMGASPPVFVPPAQPVGRGAGSKRVRNARMQREIAMKLAYPSYREALDAILSAEP